MSEQGLSTPVEPKRILLHFRKRVNGANGDVVLKNNDGRTICIAKDPEGYPGGEFFLMTEARCGKGDHFNRAIGRSIAEGRMVSERGQKWTIDRGQLLFELLRLNHRYNERYDQKFFERLLDRLVK